MNSPAVACHRNPKVRATATAGVRRTADILLKIVGVDLIPRCTPTGEEEEEDEALTLAEGVAAAEVEVGAEIGALITGNQGARITGEREMVGFLMMNPTKSCED